METAKTDILKYIKLIVNKRHLFIIIALVIMSIIVWGSYFIPKKYEARSIVFIERNVIEELVKGIAITPSMDSRIKVLRDTMLGRSLVLDVLRKLDIDSEAENDKELEQKIVDFQEKTNVNVRNNNLVTVSFTSKDPGLARDYINNLVSEYVEKNIFAKREESYDATKFLDKQVAFFKEKMDRGEEKIIKFRQEQGIYIAMNEGGVINEIQAHNKELEELQMHKNELIATKESITKQLKGEKEFTVTMFNTRDVKGTIESLENRLKQLLVNYTENYPEVIKTKAEIETLRQQGDRSAGSPVIGSESGISAINTLYQEFKHKLIEIDAEISSINAKVRHIGELIKTKEAKLRDIPENRKQLGDLEKERDSYRGIYGKLLERLGQSEVSKQMEVEDKATTFRIIEPAILPTIPVSPNRIMIIMGGIIAGFLGSFGILFLFDSMDHSLKSIDELKTLGLPVLAIIPYMQGAEELLKLRKKDVVVFGIAGFYILCILGVLGMEMMGVTYIDDFISGILIRKSL